MSSNPLGTVGAALLEGVFLAVGFIACFLPIFYALPASYCMFAAVYRTGMVPSIRPLAAGAGGIGPGVEPGYGTVAPPPPPAVY
jgi:hypothetical protein